LKDDQEEKRARTLGVFKVVKEFRDTVLENTSGCRAHFAGFFRNNPCKKVIKGTDTSKPYGQEEHRKLTYIVKRYETIREE